MPGTAYTVTLRVYAIVLQRFSPHCLLFLLRLIIQLQFSFTIVSVSIIEQTAFSRGSRHRPHSTLTSLQRKVAVCNTVTFTWADVYPHVEHSVILRSDKR